MEETKDMSHEAKTEVVKAKQKAYDEQYERLETVRVR